MEFPARADDGAKLQAQALFDDGLKLMDARRYTEACPKFLASNKLDPAGGTQMNLALCREREGKIATAVIEYQAALSQAVRDGRKERETFARERIDALGPLVPKLVIRLPDQEVRKTQITLDGVSVPPESLGIPLPLDPGPHQVDVFFETTGERKNTAFSMHLGEAKNLQFGANGGTIGGGLGTANGGASAPGRAAPDAPPQESARSKFAPYLAWAAAGALVASVVTGSFALANYITYQKECADGRNFCKSQEGIDAASRTNTHAILSTIYLGVGAAALIVIPILPSGNGTNGSGAAPRARIGMTPQGPTFAITAQF